MASFTSSQPPSRLIDLSRAKKWDDLISALDNVPSNSSDPIGTMSFLLQLQHEYNPDDDSDSDSDYDSSEPSAFSSLPYRYDPTGMSFMHIAAINDCPVEVVHAAKRCWDVLLALSSAAVNSVAAVENPLPLPQMPTFLSTSRARNGMTALHLYSLFGSDPVVLQFLAYLSGPDCLSLTDIEGNSPVGFLLDRFEGDDEAGSGMTSALDFALCDYETFRVGFENEHPDLLVGVRDLPYYAKIINENPTLLSGRDKKGISMLERAKLANEGPEIVKFLEDKITVLREVEAAYGTFESDEDLRLKFHTWDVI